MGRGCLVCWIKKLLSQTRKRIWFDAADCIDGHMTLRMLSFQGDGIPARRIKEESNYCAPAHLYSAPFGISRVVLWELVRHSSGEVLVSKWMAELLCNGYSAEGLYRTYWEGKQFYHCPVLSPQKEGPV